jgi:hypothetical protein
LRSCVTDGASRALRVGSETAVFSSRGFQGDKSNQYRKTAVLGRLELRALVDFAMQLDGPEGSRRQCNPTDLWALTRYANAPQHP